MIKAQKKKKKSQPRAVSATAKLDPLTPPEWWPELMKQLRLRYVPKFPLLYEYAPTIAFKRAQAGTKLMRQNLAGYSDTEIWQLMDGRLRRSAVSRWVKKQGVFDRVDLSHFRDILTHSKHSLKIKRATFTKI